ncbi:MAG: S-adenosylmethionine:tRNA ribosyltransferase-isomerase [Chloroflexi bacterium]|nr:S-adenosylmethionine:tRNA ribosyltransferase-isomerase [Chloroflexota bacterium]
MSALATGPARLAFELPPELEAHEPPEARGLTRDQVRLMVSYRHSGWLAHTRFDDIGHFLAPGDVLVVNRSATLPAALPVVRDDGSSLTLHVSTRLPRAADEQLWVAELRQPSANAAVRYSGGRLGEELSLPFGGRATILAAYGGDARLWAMRIETAEPLVDYLQRYGRPIRYQHVARDWPLAYYQTIYADRPGSAEMPSAGRAFTPDILAALEATGVLVARITLHAGVSSLEAAETPFPEWFEVPPETAAAVNRAERVIAVGTTAVRALESAVGEDGRVWAASGWTDLVCEPGRCVRAVNGLLTGWHPPEASHLLMLEAIAGRELLERTHAEALASRYLWHEFGDLHLILP